MRGVALDFSRPGKPTDNAFIESFNGKFRSECLNANWFLSFDEARRKCETWRRDYNDIRPHSSLGGKRRASFIRGAATPTSRAADEAGISQPTWSSVGGKLNSTSACPGAGPVIGGGGFSFLCRERLSFARVEKRAG